ncbi:tRNA (N6-threonylcarbamoyladenosine(37)-N6)-methyltransferase TrmO [Rhodoplanes azumiensis]|uniref:tRNA (N6-threonylcarbamoyladenosine(37)-N6)-methyltransferase TrmO n=1 Tax=Rhodoplanes azumiensis TaxID=1897628 RepID=A0ABW5APF5_9BRAD
MTASSETTPPRRLADQSSARPGDPPLPPLPGPVSADSADDGARPGEVTVPLPNAYDAGVFYIGRIGTPWTRRADCPRNARGSDAVCTITVDARWAAALTGVETCTHLLVLYWMDRARRDLVVQAPRHSSGVRGTFALRSPVRPNPIAASVARLVGIEGTRLSVIGLDCLDGTPLLDIKPYFASTDAVGDAVVGWHAGQKS